MANRKGARLEHGILTTSGAMANENGLKICLQKHAGADRVLAFNHAFAGRTLALSQITDKAAYRQGMPTVMAVDYVPFYDQNDPEGSRTRALEILQSHLERHPGRHAAMVFELVQGEGGYNAGHTHFFKALMGKLREAKVGIFLDEIQTFGRGPQAFAYQDFGLDDYVDVVTVGKMTQVCVTLFRDEYKPKPGLVSQTFSGTSGSIRAGQVLLNTLLQSGFLGPDGRNMQVAERFRLGLESLAARMPKKVAGPFGYGTMLAFTPYGGDAEKTGKFLKRLYELGVIAFVAGAKPSRARFLPPAGCIQDDEIDAVLALVERALEEE
jgi:4-aminobutyrate aminotransferase-like enzyme